MLEPDFCSNNLAEDRSFYDKFKYAVIENGYISWRRSASSDNIFIMNDVSMTSGQFQEDVHVHLTVTQTDGLTDMFCTCAMYGVLLQMVRRSLPDENLDDVNRTNLKCCHIRLLMI